jgi:hypothetical protein
MAIGKNSTIFLVILCAQIILLLIFVYFRYIDADEGLYLMAAHQVWQGEFPYLDFFYVQMPLLPYLYSFISHSGFNSLLGGRVISMLLTLFLGFLLYSFTKKIYNNTTISLFLFFLFSFNGLILSWNSVVKTYAFSNLFAFLSFIFYSRVFLYSKIRGLDFFLSGVFIGLASNCRSVFLLVFLAQLAIMLFVFPTRLSNLIRYLGGTILSSVLSLYLFIGNSGSFIFDNFLYHQIWGKEVIGMGLGTKIATLAKFSFYPQNLFILLLCILTMMFLVKKKKSEKNLSRKDKAHLVAFIYSIIILISYFLANPTQLQYYNQALPYLLVLSGPGLASVLELLKKRKLLLYGIGVVYIVCLIPFLLIFVFTIREKDQVFRIDQVKKVVKVVEEHSIKKEPILSDWPGYAVLSKRSVIRGTETCGQDVSHLLTEEQLKRLNVIDKGKLKEIVKNKKVNLIVTGIGTYRYLNDLIRENYYLVKETGGAEVFLRK